MPPADLQRVPRSQQHALVIERHPLIALMFESDLRSEGLGSVTLVTTRADALAAIGMVAFDLAILGILEPDDYLRPDLELAEELVGAEIPIIFTGEVVPTGLPAILTLRPFLPRLYQRSDLTSALEAIDR